MGQITYLLYQGMTSPNHGPPIATSLAHQRQHPWLSGQLMATRGSFAVSATGLTWENRRGWGWGWMGSQVRDMLKSGRLCSAPDCMQIPAVTKEAGQPAVQGLHLNVSDSMKPVGLSREKACVHTRHARHAHH